MGHVGAMWPEAGDRKTNGVGVGVSTSGVICARFLNASMESSSRSYSSSHLLDIFNNSALCNIM